MAIPDYELERRLEGMDKRFDHILAYVKRLESRVNGLERELGLKGDEDSEYPKICE